MQILIGSRLGVVQTSHNKGMKIDNVLSKDGESWTRENL